MLEFKLQVTTFVTCLVPQLGGVTLRLGIVRADNTLIMCIPVRGAGESVDQITQFYKSNLQSGYFGICPGYQKPIYWDVF